MSEYGTVIEPRTVRFERVLPGPIERVWAYLTESDKRATWLAAGAMELREGGRVELHFRNAELTRHDDSAPDKYKAYENSGSFEGRVIRCDAPRVLAFTWAEVNGTASEVTFELTPRGDDVLLVLTHRKLGDREKMLGAVAGWHTHLGILTDRLNGREPDAFWATHTALEAAYDKRIPTA